MLNGRPVAIKIERITQKKRMSDLKNEAMVYNQMQNCKGFPKMFYYGKSGVFNVLVTEYMGTTLKKLQQYVGGRFSLETVYKIGLQLVEIIESMHQNDIAYSNFSLDHIVVGNDPEQIYLMSFRRSAILERMKNFPRHEFRGGVYSSRASFIEQDITLKDDLESIAYLLLKLCWGQLPWEKLVKNQLSKRYQVTQFQLKMKLFNEMDKTNYPGQFPFSFLQYFEDELLQYLDYIHDFSEDQMPDYQYLKTIFQEGLDKFESENGAVKFDWVLLNVIFSMVVIIQKGGVRKH